MEDLILITDFIKYVLSLPLSIFGFTFSLGTVVLSTMILSIAVGFVVHIFGGD